MNDNTAIAECCRDNGAQPRNYKFRTKFILGALVCLLGGAQASVVQAQSIEEFYRGKQMTFNISTEAGGEWDVWGRLVARHMANHIPGKPHFVPQNMPGAGQIIAANYMFNVAPKDGSLIGMVGRNLPNLALLKQPNIQFDPTKFNWIGSPEITNRICVVLDKSGITKGEDLFEKELIVGGAGAGTAITGTPRLLSRMLGMKFKLVEGYGSGSAVQLAMERGEVQGICQTYGALRNSRDEWFKDGRLKILFNMEKTPITGLNVPTIYQFAKTKEQRDILTLYNSSIELGRPVAAPPGVPADRVAALRGAFDAMVKDKAFLEDAGKQKLEIDALTGKQLENLIADLMKTPAELTEKMESLQGR